MRETYAAVLLSRKADRLHKETGYLALVSKVDSGLAAAAFLAHSVIRPLKVLVLFPIVLTLSIFCGLIFGLTFLLFTTSPAIFELNYGFFTGISGLSCFGLETA